MDEAAFYRTVKALALPAFRLLARWEVVGPVTVPADGPAIICSNHISWYDIPALGSAIERPVSFMAKAELFRIPLVGTVLRKSGTFPVKRGRADRSAIHTALEILAGGGLVLIFPEGTRSPTGKPRKARKGIGLIAARAGVPVVPAAVKGSYSRRDPTRVSFAEPISASSLVDKAGSRSAAQISRVVMDQIVDLWETL